MGLGRGARCPSLDEPRSRNYFGHDCAGWLHDIKHDGLRVIARKNGMRVFHATANPALVSKRMTAASQWATWTADHLPQRAAGMPRSSSPAAMARSDSKYFVGLGHDFPIPASAIIHNAGMKVSRHTGAPFLAKAGAHAVSQAPTPGHAPCR